MKATVQTTHAALLLTLVFSFTLWGCRGDMPAILPDAPRTIGLPPALAGEPSVGELNLSDESLYVLDATWSDQGGRQVKLASLRGQPVVLSMVFTRCGWACPTIVHDMKKIAAKLPENVREEVRYVLVSMDPERDTPEMLAGFARTHRLDSRWTLLRGEASDVRVLAALLGIRYREEANGQFSHTNMLTVLNEQGEIVHLQKGLGSDPADTAAKLRDLLADNS